MANDQEFIEKIKTLSVIVKNKERLPLGNKNKGQFIPPEEGRRAIFVPSYGTMEKEEVDYVVEVAKEQEDERIKRKEVSQQKAMLEDVTLAVRQAPNKQRAKTAQKIIKEIGG